MEKNIDGLILKLFNKIINSEVDSIAKGVIHYKINNEDVGLVVINRSEKEPEPTELANLQNLKDTYFPTYYKWQICIRETTLHDFYIIVKGKSYFVPRPSLKVYVEWAEILEEHIRKYELDNFNYLLNNN